MLAANDTLSPALLLPILICPVETCRRSLRYWAETRRISVLSLPCKRASSKRQHKQSASVGASVFNEERKRCGDSIPSTQRIKRLTFTQRSTASIESDANMPDYAGVAARRTAIRAVGATTYERPTNIESATLKAEMCELKYVPSNQTTVPFAASEFYGKHSDGDATGGTAAYVSSLTLDRLFC